MPAPIPDLNRDQQCHHYQAPSGQRCGSPALKGEYYCYHHHIKNSKRTQNRVLIDPEITRMELPVVEDRASIFVALAAVVHRLAENTIDTRRAGQMIYALQTALQALPSEPLPASTQPPENCHPERAQRVEGPAVCSPKEPAVDAPKQPDPPQTIPITRQGLLYFLRSRHCAHCNAELFPAEELTERANPGAPPAIVEEARPALPAPSTIHTLQAVADPTPSRRPIPRSKLRPRPSSDTLSVCPALRPSSTSTSSSTISPRPNANSRRCSLSG